MKTPWAPETGYLPSIYSVGPYGVAHYGRGDYATTSAPPSVWTPSTLCPDPLWAPETGYVPSVYNVGPYGVTHYGRGDYAPTGATSAPLSVWTPSEMCHA